MSNISFELQDGVTINGITHKEVELRSLTGGDIIESVEKANQVFLTPQGPVLIAPDIKIMVNALLRIIVKFGTMETPLSKVVFDKISAADLDILTEKYFELRRAGSDLAAGGRT